METAAVSNITQRPALVSDIYKYRFKSQIMVANGKVSYNRRAGMIETGEEGRIENARARVGEK